MSDGRPGERVEQGGHAASVGMSWDADPQVLSPVGRPIEELLAVRPRRQALPGFQSVYSDLVDYIVRCTHRIWEEKNIGLCRTHYGVDMPMWTPSGAARGAEEVTRATVTAIAAYPDRSPVAEDVIWSEDAPGTFLSSHRITSFATHLGTDPLMGPATGLRRGVRVIADCLCRENRIIDEWLVRDNWQFARELGLHPLALARSQAAADREGDQARHGWHVAERVRVRETPGVVPPAGHPAAPIAEALGLAFDDQLFGDAAGLVSPSVEAQWAGGRHVFGRGGWIGLLVQLAAALTDLRFRLNHYAARPLPHDDIAVALRWSLVGRHGAAGVWGPPSGRELLVFAISHYRVRAGRVIEDVTLIDELAILRQIEGGLGA